MVTDINGSSEIIVNGKNGIIIPPHQSDTLCRAMAIFLTDPDLARRLSAEARPMIAPRYEQSYVHRCLKEYYKEILKEKK